MCRVKERRKQSTYNMPRTIQVENGSLTAAVFITLGGMGRKCEVNTPEERRKIL